MRISIAMATYNGASFLSEQLQSFVSQTRLPDELVVMDDGSTDGTPELIAEFARRAPFEVHFHRNEKTLGYSGNFSAALERTSGDLVFLSDQDDVWFDEKLEYQERKAAEHPKMLLFMNDAVLTDGQLNPVGLTKLGQIRSAGLADSWFIMGCCCAVRRQLLELCLPIHKDFRAHDDWIVPFAEGLNAKLLSERPLQYYRRHGSNESNFLVNQTRKVTGWDVVKQQLKHTDSKTRDEEAALRIRQLSLFCEGVERAIGRSEGQLAVQLENLLTEKRRFSTSLAERAAVRSRNVAVRVPAVFRFWIKGYYRHASGIKSVVRDLIGR